MRPEEFGFEAQEAGYRQSSGVVVLEVGALAFVRPIFLSTAISCPSIPGSRLLLPSRFPYPVPAPESVLVIKLSDHLEE